MLGPKTTMSNFRKQSAAALRFAERRQREDEAPRLCNSIPRLTKLCFAIEERSDASRASGPKHVRHIVVANAPALFFVPCGDPRCVDGGHDVTGPIMQALLAGQTTFQGQDTCFGLLGPSQCARVLHYDATAEYGA
jgi:hypothetical protein